MGIPSRRLFVLLAGLALAGLMGTGRAAGAAQDKDKDDEAKSDRVSIPTFDGMELGGTYYPRMGSKDRDAVVLCLHDFSHKKGGGSHGEWDKLAAKLQKDGYAVLTFDFRGFGNSKSVSPDFWKFRHNQGLRGFKGGVKSAESIDQKDFNGAYYMNLINDVAAARAFLDRKNDMRDLNTSNLIVIGAGQGATVGALWMAAEMHRQRDTSPPVGLLGQPPAIPVRMDEPEGKDIAAAIWLSISPNLESKPVTGAVKSALIEVARENKVPTVLVFGSNDASGSNLAENYLDAIKGGKKIELKNTGIKIIKGTELLGSALLGEKLETNAFLLKHLDKVLEDRGSKEWRKRDEMKSRYFWTLGGKSGGPPILAKQVGEKVARPIPLGLIKVER